MAHTMYLRRWMHRYSSLGSMNMDDCIPYQTPKQVSDIIGFTLLTTEGTRRGRGLSCSS